MANDAIELGNGGWLDHLADAVQPLLNLSCPANQVPEEVRKEFFDNHPAFAQAWGRQPPDASEA